MNLVRVCRTAVTDVLLHIICFNLRLGKGPEFMDSALEEEINFMMCMACHRSSGI